MEGRVVKVCFLPVVTGVLLVFMGVEVNRAPKVDMKIGEILACIRRLGTERNGNKGPL
jgi:hypothetical protein